MPRCHYYVMYSGRCAVPGEYKHGASGLQLRPGPSTLPLLVIPLLLASALRACSWGESSSAAVLTHSNGLHRHLFADGRDSPDSRTESTHS
jgi:hypothetical protein